MVLLIRATTLKGRPLDYDLSARFEESGGTIGRGDKNTLVLPDPARYISRVHATVSFQAGGFVITDNGTKNAVVLNGRPLGQGGQARLGAGDTIRIGDYTLEVSLPSPAAAQPSTPARIGNAEPFATIPSSSSKGADPFKDLFPWQQAQSAPSPPTPMWPASPPPKEPVPTPSDPLVSVRPPEPHIDEILGLKTPAADPLAAQPPPGSAIAAPRSILPDDPFESWPSLAKTSHLPAAPDHTPELNLPFFPPQTRPDLGPEPMPDAGIAAASGTPAPAAPPQISAPAVNVAPSVNREEAPARQSVSGVIPGVREELLGAFLRGSGIPDTKIQAGLTPEMMETLGRLLHEAVKGTIDLLRARATTKGEMRADVTMIMPMDNNPLKFSPSAEAALVHLLAPSIPGFAAPLRAMKEAYDDLRAHQFGFLAGMRAALDEVLARFEPKGLEERLSDPGILDSLLPMNRKAKLWDLFVERYADVAADAREDFHAAFGKAFLRAYNEQVKRLRTEERAG